MEKSGTYTGSNLANAMQLTSDRTDGKPLKRGRLGILHAEQTYVVAAWDGGDCKLALGGLCANYD